MLIAAVIPVAAAFVLLLGEPAEPGHSDATAQPTVQQSDAGKRAQRAFNAIASAAQMPQHRRRQLLDESDTIREQLQEEGKQDIGNAMRTRLREVQVSEADSRQWYVANQSMFGERSFAQSRGAVDRLIAIERVRAQFGLEE